MDISFQNGRIKTQGKQTLNRSDKGFLFELGGSRVTCGELCLAATERMWVTREIEAGPHRTAAGHGNYIAYLAGD